MVVEQLSQEMASSGDQGQRRVRFGCIDGLGRDDIPLACEVWMDDLMRSPWADRDTMKLAMHLMRYISDPNSTSVLVQEVESLCQLGREDMTMITVGVNERLGEIAVMRAIGVSRLHIVQQIVIEGIGLSVIGATVGLVLGLGTARYLNSILRGFPGLPDAIDFFLFQPGSAFRSLGLLVLAGIAAGIYPSWRAASLPISGTLREEAVG